MRKTSALTNFLRSRYVLLLSAIICFAVAFFISGKDNLDYSSASENFERVLHKKEMHSKEELKELSEKANKWTYEELFSEKTHYYESLFEREGLVFLIFENDTLRFWTDNRVAVDNLRSRNNFSGKIVKLPNGWFSIEKLFVGPTKGTDSVFQRRKKELFALILLRKEFAYQNKYLVNEFQRDFNLHSEVELKLNLDKIGQKLSGGAEVSNGDVYEKKGDYLCTLEFPSAISANSFAFYLSILLSILGLIFSIWFLQAEVRSLSDKIGKGWSVLLLAVTIGALRALTIEIEFPGVFYETKLFSPELYGDASYSWLGSLGDLLINAILLFYLSFYFFSAINAETEKYVKEIYKWIIPFTFISFLFFASGIINYIFSGLISNSDISFTLNDIFTQDIFTCAALSIAGLFIISYFLLLDKTMDVVRALELKRKQILIITLSSVLLFTVVSHLLGTVDLILVFWPVLLFGFVAWSKEKKLRYSFSVIVILLFIISFFSAHIVLKNTDRKERESRKIFAQKLSAEQDPLAEHLFTEVEIPISTDTALIHLLAHPLLTDKSPSNISSDKKEKFTRQLISKYFSGYWEKYEIKVSVFDTACLPLVQGSLPDRDNLNYFEEQISSHGIPCESNKFFYLSNSTGRLSYLARIPLMPANGSSYRIGDLFIEFDSRIVSEETGFPELMLDRKLGITPDLLDYSYAKYKNGKLIAYHGNFPYSLSAESFLPDSSSGDFPKSFFFEMDNFHHLSYMMDEDSLVIISKKKEGKIVMVTTFSYLFAFFSLILLLLLLLRFLIFEKKIYIDSFRSRIQFVLVSMVLFSLLFFGAGTVYYIQQQYERQTQQSVRDKMLSSLVEGMHELGEEKELKQTKNDFYSYVLKRMSTIFLTDITLYDKEGNLAGSSQMKMFNEGLLSRKMCTESYYRLALKQNTEFIHDEKIGQLEYLSAYCSLRNNKGDLLGYLNIPYFARQSELEKEISVILSAIINIYVLLFVISVILALGISEYFTKPLKLIQEKLSRIKLGKASEPIEWKSQDEIGSLVNEYNRMIDELQKSAELLAKSERETAWREMAKQVAHEIKNPLTPMKLSIQHLQRTWKNKEDDMDKKIERITATMIEQIETLSTIAGEFSSFAKMPASVSEKVNVKKALENCISLFKDSTDTEFVFDCALDDAFVYADKEQMLRVCNNLLKNALQAIPENRQGKIGVSLTRKNNSLLIKIKDNGTGIAEDKRNKIFTPDFTTKSGGMGLGLAMVKSIVETFSGKIWFETSRGNGSAFFVSLPEYKD